ncbi:glycerophosphoryl diester phosphodiesterase [Thermocladium modestius]|uniref:Glycerophosphoryl diester phosphodiesterase n=1 Tax=Thermocladium modestius TaxID=62609 RepID=A0A830GWI1_9CREN|nr:glycerophosphodiester phosphodiesterase family protein [Thermocladium modestius]GGP21006.1 glycerophosphoryl diester phosphodiesterase [Thermocladium modestius]
MLIYGHRGARGRAPENTIPSFSLAKEMGVDGVELDVHLTKDGEVVVMHDAAVDRTTNGSGLISRMTMEEVRRLDAGVKFGEKWAGTRVPTLGEVFSAIGRGIKYKVEIKRGSDFYPGIEEKVLDIIRKHGVDAQVISFDFDALERVRELDGGVELGLIFVGRIRWFIEPARRLEAQWLHASHELIDGKGVAEAHSMGLRVGAWTVNDAEAAAALAGMGVDDITSDYPDSIIAAIRKAGKTH